MNSAVGVVLVHGIGNQRPGMLGHEMMMRLADGGTCAESIFSLPVDSRHTQVNGDILEVVPTHRLTVRGTQVQLREANWAPLSHPDNPPRLRLAPYVFRDFVETVSAAWYSSAIASAYRRLNRKASATRATILWGGVALIVTVLFLLAYFGQVPTDLTYGVLTGSLLLSGFYLMYRILRYRYLLLRHASRKRRIAALVLWLPIAYVAGFLQLVVLFASAEILIFLFFAVLVAVALDYVAYIPTQVFCALGWVFAKLRMKTTRRWVHRLGWVMIVLPVHTILQAVKATGNLISIFLTEPEARVRLATVRWFLGVYGWFLITAVFSEFLLLPLIMFFQGGVGEIMANLNAIIVLTVVYLLILKRSLPAVDLILDISNYHLASVKDRLPYYDAVEKAVTSLRETGCVEIHILAHSLGSVITYDWLCSNRSEDCPIATLHTIGSPLNKFWYIDHMRTRRLADKEGLASLPVRRWTNYWAYSDVISGFLARYGGPTAGISHKRLRRLGPAFVSHVRYWKNPVVLDSIREEVVVSAHTNT